MSQTVCKCLMYLGSKVRTIGMDPAIDIGMNNEANEDYDGQRVVEDVLLSKGACPLFTERYAETICGAFVTWDAASDGFDYTAAIDFALEWKPAHPNHMAQTGGAHEGNWMIESLEEVAEL